MPKTRAGKRDDARWAPKYVRADQLMLVLPHRYLLPLLKQFERCVLPSVDSYTRHRWRQRIVEELEAGTEESIVRMKYRLSPGQLKNVVEMHERYRTSRETVQRQLVKPPRGPRIGRA